MYSPTAAAIFLLFSTILGFTNISTGLLVSTRHVTRLIGGQLRLNCSDPSTTSLYWSRESVGSAKPVYIYFPPFGLTQTYKADGRHRVELDISSGSCDLLIERLLIEDAGTYSCRTDDGEHQEIELVIIGAKTVCTSNKSLPRVLVENDCDMEPDHMELNCSAAYRGNIPPLLEWHHSSKSDVEMERYVVNRRTSADNFVVMHYMTVKLDWKFNGSNFVCSLKDVMTRNGGIGCATRKLSVMYFFHTPPTHVITEYGDNMINVSCIANTSETCSYRWQATEVRTNNPIDIHRQTISLIPKNYDDVKCFAECRVRNKICTTQPMDLKHSFADTDGDLLIMVLLPVLLIISLAVVITVGFICFRKSGSFRDMIHKKRRRANGDLTEMQSLNPFLESITDFIRGNVSTLVECLDTENGFAECLLSKRILNADQCDVITNRNAYPSYRNQNKTLLLDMILPNLTTESMYESFMEALIETDQRHIYNFIIHSVFPSTGETIQPKDVLCRILSEHELERIDRHTFLLIPLLDAKKSHFLDSLVDEGCLTKRHKNRIKGTIIEEDKNKELLSIIRRRSYSNFVSFIDALKRTKQDKAAQLLEQQTGGVVPVHCEISAIEGDAVTSSEDIKEIETKISELLNNTRGLSRKQKQSVARRLKELSQQYLSHLMAAYPTGSIVVYFLCQTFRSIVVLKGMIDSGQMKNILEDIFNCILENDLIRLKLEVSLDLEEYQKRIQVARTTVYLETEITKHHECYMRSLPREMLELILLQSMIGIMSVEWTTTVRDNESVSGSYNLYETVANKTWMSGCISLKSVAYQWMHARYLKKRDVLKRFFFRRLHEHNRLFSEQLNCRYVFVDCLEKEGIITQKERRNIMEVDDDVATRTYEDIPESCWPQIRDSEQMLMSNKKLLKCVLEKNYSQISKFLKLMEDNCLTHILNYFISNKESVGDVWPLRDAQRIHIIKSGTSIVKNMNILALSEVREKKKESGEESGTTDGRRYAGTGSKHPSEKTEGYDGSTTRHFQPSEGGTDRLIPIIKDAEEEVPELPEPLDANIHLDTTIDELQRHREVTGSNRDRQNLIDLLYNEGCISLLHKHHIEKQPTQQLQNLEMLQLIKNGSFKTFKVALEYFRRTNQNRVFDMLDRKYFSEEIQSSQKIIRTYAWVMGVAWLEENIYVVTNRSDVVYVHPDQESIDGSKDEKIELEGMKNPWDMAASKLSRSIFISDRDNRCLWRIQMHGREISRWEVGGTPSNMSVSSTDMLVVRVFRDYRKCLNLYRSSDVMLMNSIPLPTETEVTDQAVQLSNGNFVISCSMKDDPDVFLIRELSVDGRNFIRRLDHRSIALNRLDYWIPYYLSIDEDENIFIADRDNDRVVLLNSRWTDVRILLNKDQHSIESPWRLCYVREKQQLIVGRGGISGSTCDVRVFNLCPHVPHTDRRTLTNELELIKSVPFDQVESKMCDTSNPSPRMPDIQLVKRFEVEEGTKGSPVDGVTWLENKIYVVCRGSSRVHVFPDQALDELKKEGIKIEGMKQPWDMSASKVSRSIFISDPDKRCLWRVQMPGGGVSRWKIDGSPHGLSITSSDELLVAVIREDCWYLDMFSCSDVNRKQSIPLSTEINKVWHAVQSSNYNIIISHSTKNFPDVYLISELSIDGTNFIRTFDHRSVQSMNIQNWEPYHLSFDDDGELFVADFRHSRVYLLSSQLTDIQILLKRFQHQLDRPHRLCYVREKKQLIVGQTGSPGEPGVVSVFNVRPQ